MRFSGVSLILLLAVTITPVNAAPIDRVELSESFAVELPAELHAQMGAMPSFDGFWLEGKKGKKKISIWIQRKDPPTTANAFSVKRLWKDGITQATNMGETSQDKGCHSLGKYLYGCERRAHAKHERFASERLIWNANSDLVVVRVMSSVSYEEAESVAKMIQFKPITKLSADLQIHDPNLESPKPASEEGSPEGSP